MKIADLHQDIAYAIKTGGYQPELNKNLFMDFNEDIKGRHGDIPKYKKGNIKLIFGAIFPAINTISEFELERLKRLYPSLKESTISYIGNFEEVIDQALIYRKLIRRYHDSLSLVRERKDFDLLENSSKIGILMSLEGLDSLKKPDDIEILFVLGIRSIALTWNYDNKFASSCTSKKDFGLTSAGEKVVELANELGMILDISHAGKNTVLEVASISKLPVIASHSNYFAIANHKRNLDDDMLEAIRKTKGIVGFTFIRSTIGENPGIEELSKHIIAVKESFGSDILAIGSDFFGIANTPLGLEDASKIPLLLDYLKKKGFSDEDLEKIAWKNCARIIKEHMNKWIDKL
jgi:membrane dipeptidase